jgi:hypothetical protein
MIFKPKPKEKKKRESEVIEEEEVGKKKRRRRRFKIPSHFKRFIVIFIWIFC